MSRYTLRLVVFSLLVVAASAAQAEVFTVTLTNGTTFLTRYRPEPAEWNPDLHMFRTDRGNWIGVSIDEIADVTSKAETTGFGYQLNSTTLFVGWSPNDIDEGGEKEGEGLDLEAMFPEEDTGFTLEQFVDVPDVGAGVGAQAVDFVD